MILKYLPAKIKLFMGRHLRPLNNLPNEVYISAIIIMVGLSGFALGRLSVFEEIREPIKIMYPDRGVSGTENATLPENFDIGGQLVASKNGSKYHFPWCSGAQRISEKNKIYFNSTEEARASGYTPAANCKGLD